jgi:quercetin dioxygenase-like cupin family protein
MDKLRFAGMAAIGVLAMVASNAARAQAVHDAAGDPGAMQHMVLIEEDDHIQYKPGFPTLPKGMDMAVLSGDPAKAGEPFTLRVTVPKHFVIAPHSHPTTETLTVIDGEIWHGIGTTVDKTKGQKLDEGGFAFVPANTVHYLWTKDDKTVLQVNGTGPFQVLWANPADDPKNAK